MKVFLVKSGHLFASMVGRLHVIPPPPPSNPPPDSQSSKDEMDMDVDDNNGGADNDSTGTSWTVSVVPTTTEEETSSVGSSPVPSRQKLSATSCVPRVGQKCRGDYLTVNSTKCHRPYANFGRRWTVT